MKQKLLLTILLMIVFVLPFSANASTSFGMYPVKVSVKAGQTFNLAVKVDSNGQKNYTVKTSIKFPADLVSVKTWQYADNWMPLRKGGYDSFSNTDGTLMRTAGYPDGFEGLTIFGTATFVAKKSGTGIIEFSGDTMALDENNANQYSVSNKVSLTVVSPEVVQPAPAPAPAPEQPPMVSQQAPEQLFDINLQIGTPVISKTSELTARVLFNSFGTVLTPFDMTFDILDGNNNVVYSEKGSITIQTEGVYDKTFNDSNITPGAYTLRLTTMYNGKVRDEFRQSFKVVSQAVSSEVAGVSASSMPAEIIFWAVLIVITAGVIGLAVWMFGKRKKNT